jgi:PST family polysaccharide transporter
VSGARQRSLRHFFDHPAFANAGWIISERVGRLCISLVVGILVFRKLGVDRLGAFNYALTVSSLFVPLSTFGIGENLVRQLVGGRANGAVLGTAFRMRAVGTLAAYGLGLAAFLFVPNNTTATLGDAAVAGLALWSAPLLVLDPYFQSLTRSRVVTACGLTAGMVAAAVKIVGVLTDAPIKYFLFANALDAILLGAGLLAVYVLTTPGERWRFDMPTARGLMREAIPCILSGFAVFIYDQSDVLLLGVLAASREAADHQIGLYTAAVRLSSMWRFVPLAILSSAVPFLYRAQQRDDALYRAALIQTISIVMACSYVFIIPLAIWPGHAIQLLLGDGYREAAPVLRVHVFSNAFAILGVAQSTWLIGRGMLWAGLRNTLVGAVANFILNILVIPQYGALGAAATTVVATCLVSIPSNALFPATRPLADMLTRGMMLAGLPAAIRRFRKA